MATADARASIPKASVRDTLNVLGRVVAPTAAKGVIIRRPKVVGAAESLDLDRRAVRVMQRLRERSGPGPLMLRVPGRRQAVVLEPAHVRRVLDETPDPFATDTKEKRAALAHFEPRGSLISRGPERAERRRFNEEVLGSDTPMHRLAADLVAVAERAAAAMLDAARRGGALDWDSFADAWFRMVREVIFGPGAREDDELSRMTEELRSRANWAFLAPRRSRLRDAFHERIRQHLSRAEPGSLAAAAAGVRQSGATAPEQQVPQWLFAFDPAGMTTFRALGLLATHPERAARAREEVRGREPASEPFPFLRAVVLESLRLWPTTPLVLRETTRETEWETGVMPAGTGILIFAPYFHRDDQRLPYADRFAPEVWEGGVDAPRDWPLIPFSHGPGVCPGRHLVLLLSTAVLARILVAGEVRLTRPERLDPVRPLPGTLDNYTLRFVLG